MEPSDKNSVMRRLIFYLIFFLLLCVSPADLFAYTDMNTGENSIIEPNKQVYKNLAGALELTGNINNQNCAGLPVPHPTPSGRDIEELSTLDTNSGVKLFGLVRGDALSITSDIDHSFTSSMVSIMAEGPVHNLNTGINYSTIQAAINAANSSDTISVDAGTYIENVDVNISVNLVGAGASVTIVNAANASRHVFNITANNVNISGFTVTGAPSATGMLLNNVANCNISNNDVLNNWQGIYLDSSNDCIIVNNTASSNVNNGIILYDSDNNIISSNNASNNINYDGIAVFFSNNNTIKRNIVNLNEWGIVLSLFSTNNSIGNNTINSNDVCGIDLLYNSSNNTIMNNNINYNGGNGIHVLYDSNNNTIKGNIITLNSAYGILLGYSSNYNGMSYNTIVDNVISDITIEDSEYSSVTNNEACTINYTATNTVENNECNWCTETIDSGNVNISGVSSDIDGDSKADDYVALHSSDSNSIYVYTNNDGAWTKKLVDSGVLGNLLVRDVDGDSDEDIFALGIGSSVQALQTYSSSGESRRNWVTNADGRLANSNFRYGVGLKPSDRGSYSTNDISALSNSDASIYLYLNDGSWTKSTVATFTSGSIYYNVLNIDGDSDYDVIVNRFSQSSSTTGLYVFENTGSSWSQVKVASGTGYQGYHPDDFDGDNDMDFIVAFYEGGATRIEYYKNAGGNWVKNWTSPTNYAGYIQASTSIDADGDLDLDIFVWMRDSSKDYIRLLTNLGNGSWNVSDVYETSLYIYDYVVDDFNGDSKGDVVISTYDDNTYLSLVTNISGSWTTQSIYTGSIDLIFGAPDFDGDSDRDLLGVDTNSSTVNYFSIENDNGVFTTKQDIGSIPYSTGMYGYWWDILFDGDYDVDVVGIAADPSSENLNLYLFRNDDVSWSGKSMGPASGRTIKSTNSIEADDRPHRDFIMSSYDESSDKGYLTLFKNPSNGGRDADGDGISDCSDSCPQRPETFNGCGDSDGCPDACPSSGGGGGGAPPADFGETIREIKKGESFTLEIDDKDVPYLNAITIEASQDTFSARVSISDLDKKPWSSMEEPNASIYRYFKMKYSKDRYVEKALVDFRINKSYMEGNYIAPDTVRMYRYDHGWEELDTKVLKGDDDEWVYFQAETSEFSYFSIGGTEGSESEEAISSAESAISKALSSGLAVRWVGDLLKSARSDQHSGEYVGAKSKAMDANQIVRNAINARDSISYARGYIERTKKWGADAREPENILKEANNSLTRGNYSVAKARAVESLNEARMSSIEFLEKCISGANKLGADTKVPEEKLQEIEIIFATRTVK